MKYSILLFLFFLVNSCQTGTTEQSSSETQTPVESAAPVPQATSPVPYSTDSPELLRDFVRTTMRTELAFTLPEQNGNIVAKKSYSFDVEEVNGRPTWIIKLKWHDASTDKLYAGAEFLLLWEVVEVNSIQIVNSADGQKTGISIRPTEGDTFVYHPYSNDPDVGVNEVILGWYDHGQDATLLRTYTYMKQLAANMGKWGK